MKALLIGLLNGGYCGKISKTPIGCLSVYTSRIITAVLLDEISLSIIDVHKAFKFM